MAPRQREAKRAERAEKAEQNASKPQHEKLSTTLPQEPTPSVPAGDDAERANGPRADAGSGSSEGAGTKASAGQLPPNAEQSLAASVAGAGTNMEDGVTNDGDRETISGDRERDSEIMSSNTNGVKRERASASDVHDNGSVVVPTAGTRVATDQAIAFDRSKRAAAASAKLRDDADHDDALDLDSDEVSSSTSLLSFMFLDCVCLRPRDLRFDVLFSGKVRARFARRSLSLVFCSLGHFVIFRL